MVKSDIKIVKEFLGTTDVKEFTTPMKCMRYYFKENNFTDGVLILTPMLYENREALNQFLIAQHVSGHPVKAIEHQRGKNRVYTFEEIETVTSER